ncbi:MAG: hypothetical protein MRY32_00650 [Rickettsiales bacterium]|nr:hypothetical protein [Rickettsiales bacterium]
MREACAKVDALNLDLGSLGCKLNGSCNQNDLTYGGKQAAAFTEQAIVDPSKIMV